MKKLESLGLDKFQQSSLKRYELNLFGGSNKTGGGLDGTLDPDTFESYDEDTLHDNGGISWETTDFVHMECIDL